MHNSCRHNIRLWSHVLHKWTIKVFICKFIFFFLNICVWSNECIFQKSCEASSIKMHVLSCNDQTTVQWSYSNSTAVLNLTHLCAILDQNLFVGQLNVMIIITYPLFFDRIRITFSFFNTSQVYLKLHLQETLMP